ncbi:MAG: class I SAM-dependent methyltransferase [Candidatus Marinimicrobia bacterium]|nr:class I SAM-dependent methyltransferase [Candidatus Neomarinimicrobiota bacterium]MCF7828708.1 class I SAM-dependent methyltransferase [Candidatus Neomarinimicrobiota bacterium]MCF7880449.1 class I SAM-dependent methyltransferase [Candidatus Neomarinimicrobiota bacterium]
MNEIRPCPACKGRELKEEYFEEPFYVMKCQNCDLVFLGNPPEDESLYDEFYAGSGDSGEDYHADSPVLTLREMYHINAQRIELITRFENTGFLLDIGCGNGFFLASLKEQTSIDGLGVDIAGDAVEFARREFGVAAKTATIGDLLEEEHRFDIITLWHVLEHFKDPFRILRKVHALLKPGGACVIEVPNLNSLKFRLAREKWEGGNHPRYHRTFLRRRHSGER